MSPLRQTAVARSLLVISFICILGISSSRQPAEAEGGPSLYLPLISKPNPFPRGTNILANSSFEGGWHHPNNIPELQIPENWVFTWEEQICDPVQECDNPITEEENDYWNRWVRPEVRVLPSEQLPSNEHDLFIWDGDQTLKVFKGWGSISYTLTQNIWLNPGTYVFEMSVFPDLVDHYENGEKVWASDPRSGEVRLLAGSATTARMLPAFGRKNTYYLVFEVSHGRNVQMGVDIRGRYALRNNGWFLDDWHLWKATELTPPPGVYTDQTTPPFFAADYVPPAEPFVYPLGPAE